MAPRRLRDGALIWPGKVDNVGPARASHPVGLINAGDPRSAADDAYEFGQVYLARTSIALRWAALVLACAPWAFAAQGAAPKGLAAKYHDDQGIAKDPAVIFADDFES
ncbi:MAG: hypothetical protein FJ290_24795, partial [Planctomycetes bacterium]|nr:hypothetical protein [Planctomycetota bacterium]